HLGSARASRASDGAIAITDFSSALPLKSFSLNKDCFGVAPKPAREARALPRKVLALITFSRRGPRAREVRPLPQNPTNRRDNRTALVRLFSQTRHSRSDRRTPRPPRPRHGGRRGWRHHSSRRGATARRLPESPCR